MIDLTEMQNGYDGVPTKLEVMAFTRTDHYEPDDKPGVYLQRVEGCGYYVIEMTAEQAAESRKAFAEKSEIGEAND